LAEIDDYYYKKKEYLSKLESLKLIYSMFNGVFVGSMDDADESVD